MIISTLVALARLDEIGMMVTTDEISVISSD